MTSGSGETGEDGSGSTAAPTTAQAALSRLPPGLQRLMTQLSSMWLGRIVVESVGKFLRLEMFDRSMTIAAQFFTAVFPILILFTTWASNRESNWLADALSVPEETRSVLEDALQGAGGASFGVLGTLIVLASATSLSRALTRAFATIWAIPRPRSNLGSLWRWLSVVLVLTLSIVLARAATKPLDAVPPEGLLPIVASFAADSAVALFVPWVLLSGAVHPRLLVPGALLFGLLMLAVRPATAAWLPHALEVSADRYGAIGVAFTYLACLYAASLCFLATTLIGKVIATDPGELGQRIQGPEAATETKAAES
jgi:membrane protein